MNLVILMILDNYPFLDYLPIGALDGATEIGPSFKGLLVCFLIGEFSGRNGETRVGHYNWRPREPNALSGVFRLLPGSYLIGDFPF